VKELEGEIQTKTEERDAAKKTLDSLAGSEQYNDYVTLYDENGKILWENIAKMSKEQLESIFT
jgi:hypothetical protein